MSEIFIPFKFTFCFYTVSAERLCFTWFVLLLVVERGEAKPRHKSTKFAHSRLTTDDLRRQTLFVSNVRLILARPFDQDCLKPVTGAPINCNKRDMVVTQFRLKRKWQRTMNPRKRSQSITAIN